MFPYSYKDINRIVTEKYLNYNSGFFIEVGGADGFTQSNTWHLEKYKNWTGILVEPNFDAAMKCRDNRPLSDVFNCALVGPDYAENEIKMFKRFWYNGDPGLTTSTYDSAINDSPNWKGYNSEFTIPAVTLNSILENSGLDNKKIDFFSLDVEGYELEVLKGLDLKRFCPRVILIEWHLDIEDVKKLLDETHSLEEKLSDHDYVFLARKSN
jgi:FkbM family methyltransferase